MQDAIESLMRLFERGGPVMWPLLALSVVSLAITFERSVFWLRTHTPGRRRWVMGIAGLWRRGNDAEAHAQAARDRTLYGRLVRDLSGHRSAGEAIAEVYRPEYERFATTHATIITAAPLLGILGTVLGIIESFELLNIGGGTGEGVQDINAVAGGIAEALITTAFGLIIALVTLGPAMAFRAQADRCLGAIELLAVAAATTAGNNSTEAQAAAPEAPEAPDESGTA